MGSEKRLLSAGQWGVPDVNLWREIGPSSGLLDLALDAAATALQTGSLAGCVEF